MESSVSSQLTGKVYNAPLSKLYKGDIDAKSELFEINIFNTVLHIAPGKSIADEDGLVYFYVYAIKDEKVVANLGVYELITDEQKELYDISTFDNLLLFDYYYTTPSKIKEFEIKGKNNIFQYIDTHLEAETDKKKLVSIFNQLLAYIKAEKEALGDNYKLYYNVLSILSTNIKTLGIPKETLDKLKEKCDSEKKKPLEQFKICLALLEPFYSVHFLFIDNGETVSNFRDKTPTQTFKPKQYIIVSTDQSFVSTSSTLKEPEPEEEDEDQAEEKAQPKSSKSKTVEVDETEKEFDEPSEDSSKPSKAAEAAEASEESEATKSEASEPKSRPKITPKPRVPKLKSKVDTAQSESKLSVIPEVKESKAESKSESKAESKETKSKVSKVTKLKSESQAESKAESQAETKESKSKVKMSKAESKPESKESKESKSKEKESKDVPETVAEKSPRKLKSKPSA